MIEYLAIRNFQIHRRLDLPLDSAVTTIVGTTDTGKSAIIRALCWVIQNRPTGTQFIHRGRKTCRVSIIVDGQKVTRARNKSGNGYKIDEQQYKAIGHDVPQDVRDLLRIADVSIQAQHDAPFWFNETAGEVSRQLNQIINLDIIDTTLNNLGSSLKRTRMKESLLADRVQQAKSTMDELGFVQTMNESLEALEQQAVEQQETTRRWRLLRRCLNGAARLRGEVRAAAQQKTAISHVVRIGTTWHEADTVMQELQEVISVAETAGEAATLPVPQMDNLETTYRTSADLRIAARNLQSLIVEMETAQEQATTYEQKACAAEVELKKRIGDICPLCETPLQ